SCITSSASCAWPHTSSENRNATCCARIINWSMAASSPAAAARTSGAYGSSGTASAVRLSERCRCGAFVTGTAPFVPSSRRPHLSCVMAQHIGLAALLIVLVSPVMAQTPVSLDDALASARANNPALAAARARADAADAGAAVARGAWFPRVTLTESVTRSDQPVFAFGAMLSARQFTAADFAVARLNSPGATSLFTTRVGVQQLIFDGGRTSAAVSESSARRDGARAAA